MVETIVVEELEEIELKSRKLKIMGRMKRNLGEFEMKMLKNKIKASEKKLEKKIARKKAIKIEEAKREIHKKRKMTTLETRTRAELETERINKIKELKLRPFDFLS